MASKKQRRCKYAKCRKPIPLTARPDKDFCDSHCRKLERNRRLAKDGLCRACAKPRDPNSKVFCFNHLVKCRQYKAKSVKGKK